MIEGMTFRTALKSDELIACYLIEISAIAGKVYPLENGVKLIRSASAMS